MCVVLLCVRCVRVRAYGPAETSKATPRKQSIPTDRDSELAAREEHEGKKRRKGTRGAFC